MAISLSNEERAEVHKAFLEIDKARVRTCRYDGSMYGVSKNVYTPTSGWLVGLFFMFNVGIFYTYIPYMDPMGLNLDHFVRCKRLRYTTYCIKISICPLICSQSSWGVYYTPSSTGG